MIKHIKKDHIHTASVYVFAVLFAVGLSFFAKNPNEKNHGVIVGQNDNNIKNQEIEALDFFDRKAFENLKITANAYVVYDVVGKKVIASRNENKKLPLASLTKIMTGITALSMYEKDKKIIINSKNIVESLDLGLKSNQSWKLDELLKYTLVFSSNDGAQAIAENLGGEDVFITNMNKVAIELNLDMKFTNAAGLDLKGMVGGTGSALDVAKMMIVAQKLMPQILDSTTHTRVSAVSSSGTLNGIPNTNQIVDKFSGLEASKTGFTDMAGGNLALVVDVTLGRPVVIVILGSTKNERFTDAYKLYNALKKSISR